MVECLQCVPTLHANFDLYAIVVPSEYTQNSPRYLVVVEEIKLEVVGISNI